jgi:probable F420-dependent oxidoreductase
VHVGLTIFLTDYTLAPERVGRLAEERGFESLLLPEHTHIPASREPTSASGDSLPRKYWHTYDPFGALAFIARVTSRIKLGTGVCLVVERDPITTAKEVATVDRLSGGRFLFGVGAGWNEQEMSNHGTDPRRRFSLMRERVEAMKALWTEDEPEYHGDLVDFDPVWSFPKPRQEPHPPVIVGGHGEKVIDRVLAYGDEWMPNARQPLDELPGRIEELQRRASEAGRGRIPIGYYGAPDDPEQLARMEEMGVDRAVLMLETESPADVERQISELAPLAERFNGG